MVTPGSTEGALNGTTAVTVVPAPATGAKRIVRQVEIVNPLDGDTVTLTVRKVRAAGTPRRIGAPTVLGPGEDWHLLPGEVHVLDDDDVSIEAVLDVIPGVQPDFTSSWADKT